MDMYNCRVRLGGNVLHDVPRTEISEKEIHLLRDLHGADAVFDMRKVATIVRDEADELMELAKTYGRPKVEACFKVKLDGFDTWMQRQREEADAAEARANEDKRAAERDAKTRTTEVKVGARQA